MVKIHKNVMELIGKTPLVELTNIEKKYGIDGRLLAKLEYTNPAGSIKDRAAKEMIEGACWSRELRSLSLPPEIRGSDWRLFRLSKDTGLFSQCRKL